MTKKYPVPSFLTNIDQDRYERWLRRKAAVHLKRDKAKGNAVASGESYRKAIHAAVEASNGLDVYTGEQLNWSLISTFNGDDARRGGREHKATFALLPTVDHLGDGMCEGNFAICSWRTNDAKNDLSRSDFVQLCRDVVRYYDSTNKGND